MPTLPTDPKERKRIPITTGVLDYFPDAIAEVAKVSLAGNEQHNPGQPLHWAKEKSTDHADCIARHLIERGSTDTDGQRHSAKLAWRALANLQIELEQAMIEEAERENEEQRALPMYGEREKSDPVMAAIRAEQEIALDDLDLMSGNRK